MQEVCTEICNFSIQKFSLLADEKYISIKIARKTVTGKAIRLTLNTFVSLYLSLAQAPNSSVFNCLSTLSRLLYQSVVKPKLKTYLSMTQDL